VDIGVAEFVAEFAISVTTIASVNRIAFMSPLSAGGRARTIPRQWRS
jgi:hypothetical protein